MTGGFEIACVATGQPYCRTADQNGANRKHRCRWVLEFSLFLASLAIGGCGSHEPALTKGSVKFVGELKTAVASKRTDWLESAAKHIEGAHQKGILSEDEYAALEPIVADGRQGHWDDANVQMTRLIKAQYGR